MFGDIPYERYSTGHRYSGRSRPLLLGHKPCSTPGRFTGAAAIANGKITATRRWVLLWDHFGTTRYARY